MPDPGWGLGGQGGEKSAGEQPWTRHLVSRRTDEQNRCRKAHGPSRVETGS